MIACPKQALWERLCDALGRDGVLEDERFATFAGRDAHRAELVALLEPIFRSRTTAECSRC